MPIVDPFAPKAPAIVDPFAQQAAPQARGIVDPFATPEPTPESQSGFRQIADIPLQATKGAVEGVRMLTDALGADNPVSKGLRGVEDYVGDLLSAQSKKDAKEISRIMKDAEDKGVADQVLAGVKAFSVAPGDILARVFGNAMPVIAGGLATTLLRGGAMAATAIGAGTGAAMGAGSVKGSIYDAVKEILSTNTKLPPDQIEKRAALAQSYGGDNLDQILMGTAIGGISAATGLEGVVARQLAQKIAGRSTGNILQREAVEKATQEATKTAAKRGAYKQAAITGGAEAGTEFGQEAQEQVAQNIAQQREGFNVPTFRGAVGAGTMGALSATGLGAAAGAREGSQARRQMELEGTPEGQQIKNLDALLAQEEKQQRITELEQKPARTKQEQIEVDALKQSVAAGPALTQQDMIVPPAQDELTRLKAKVDEAKAKVDAAEQRFGEAPEFLVDDYEGLKTTLESKLQALESPAIRKERAAREKVQKEMDVERAAIQAEPVKETQLEGPEPPDIFAPAPKQTAIVDPFEVDPFGAETAQETLKPRAQEVVDETPIDQGAPVSTEVLDEDAILADQETAKLTPEHIDNQRQLYKQLIGNEVSVDDFIDQDVDELVPEYEYYSATPQRYGHPVDITPINNRVEARKAEAEGKAVYAIEKKPELTTDALYAKASALEKEQLSLLKKNGHLPNQGTPKRQRWDELTAEIRKLKRQWAEANARESGKTTPSAEPGALFAGEALESAKYAGPKGWETAETGVKVSSSLHPDVVRAIENNDVNGALRAMAQNTSGFARELATRLAELNLPVTIVFGQQRKLFRKEIDRQTAPQQVHLFSYIRQMYPDLYTKYFENFDREENLERVMDGLREFDKGKYKKAPIESEFKSVVKVFGELIPNMNAPGFFLPAFDVININPNPTFGTSNRVVLHEIVHAATEFALRSPDGLSKRQIEAVAELQKMYRYAKDRLPAGEYGLKSISEFVAELMTNKGFQDKLKNIKYQAKGASVFSRIVNAIMKLLGFDNLAGAAAIEVNEIFSAHRPFKVFPVGPLFAAKKMDRDGPISNPDNWKIAERDGKNIKERISDLIGGHPTKADAVKDLKDIIFDVAGVSARKVILPVLQLRQLKDMTRGTLPQLEASVGIVEQLTSYRGNKISGPVNGDISKSPEGITKRWSKAQGENPAQSRLMGRLMLEVTIRGIEVDPKGEGYSASKVNKALSDAWNTLTPEFQEIYRDARDFYARSVQDMVQAMKDRTIGLPEVDRKKLIAQIDEQFGPDKLMRPYFPLRRFGDYWFQVGEGDNKEFYMFESAAERRRALNERRRELQNGNEKQQDLADTLYAGQGISTIYSHNANTSKVLKDVTELVDNLSATQKPLTTVGPTTILSTFSQQELKKELNDSINQLVYLLLPQQSMRKMFINRRAVQGASADMLRVFAMTSVHSAYQQARFKYAEPFINNISNADKYIDQLPVEQQIVYRDFVRELEARTQTVLGIEDKSAWAKMAGRITESTFFFMLTAPASAMLNIIGMQAITMPYIGGKYGYAETNKLMLKNLGRYIGTTAKRTVGPLKAGAFSSIEFPSITDSKDLDPIERRAAERFTQDGQWNISSTHDVFNMSEQPSAMYTGRTNTVKQALAAMFHQAERLNREVAMLTAFKLAYDKFKDSDKKDIRGVVERDQNGNPVKLTEEEAFEAAIADAGDIAGLTLGDYTRQMKGRIFTKPGVNVLLQFKQYAITTSYVVLRNLYLALGAPFSKGEIAQFRAELEKNKDLTTEDIDRKVGEMEVQRKEMYKEGRRRLAGILGMAFLYGGVTAMPFFSMLGPLVRMFNDDDEDDEYLNWQNDFYNGMEDMLGGWASSMYLSTGGDPQKVAEADAFGRAMASVITRGAVSTGTGTALADRVSLDLKNLWFRDGKFSPDMRESLKEEVIANLGPATGLLFNWADGWKLFQEGQVARAFETVAPAILSKPATAIRLGTEGATNKKGVVVGNMYAEEFSAWNLAMEALGFQTEKRAMAQKKAFQAVEYDQKVQARHDELMNRIWFDIKFGSDTLEATLEKAAEFSAKYPGMPITPESVFNTVIKRAESDAEAEAIGARLNKKMLYKTLPMLGQ